VDADPHYARWRAKAQAKGARATTGGAAVRLTAGRPTPDGTVSFPVKGTVLQENFWLQGWPDMWRAAGPPTTHGAALRYHAATILR
jgi:hypothetical protein